MITHLGLWNCVEYKFLYFWLSVYEWKLKTKKLNSKTSWYWQIQSCISKILFRQNLFRRFFSRQGQNIELRNRTVMPQTQIILSLYLCNLISMFKFQALNFTRAAIFFCWIPIIPIPQILISPLVTFNFFFRINS